MARFRELLILSVICYAVALQDFQPWLEIEEARPINSPKASNIFTSRLLAKKDNLPVLKIRGLETVQTSFKQPKVETSEQKLPEIMKRLGLNQVG